MYHISIDSLQITFVMEFGCSVNWMQHLLKSEMECLTNIQKYVSLLIGSVSLLKTSLILCNLFDDLFGLFVWIVCLYCLFVCLFVCLFICIWFIYIINIS